MTKGIALYLIAFNPRNREAVAATEYNIDVEAIDPNPGPFKLLRRQ